MSILDRLREASPVSRLVSVDNWPEPVTVWRLSPLDRVKALREVASLPKKEDGQYATQEAALEATVVLLAHSMGDEGSPGQFNCPEGRQLLRRQDDATLMHLLDEFNALNQLKRAPAEIEDATKN